MASVTSTYKSQLTLISVCDNETMHEPESSAETVQAPSPQMYERTPA